MDEARGLDGRRVLVTGGAGFIGSHLVRRLVDLGAAVRVLDDLSGGSASNLAGVAGVELIEASVLDPGALAAATAGCGLVVHLAAIVSVPRSVEDPEGTMAANATGTQRVLLAARDAGSARVVVASSSAVYGDRPSLPSSERDPVDCFSPYAASKAAGEAVTAAFGRCYGLSTASLRFFNVYGSRQDPHSPYAAVIAAFAKALRAGQRPVIFGDGEQSRDFVSVDDVVQAIVRAATCDRALAGEAINVGTGRGATLLEVLGIMGRALGVEPEPVFEPARAGDVRHSRADIARARELLGYAPAVQLEEGLAGLLKRS